MSLTVHAMWVHGVEKPPPQIKPEQAPRPRYVQVPFSVDYKCYHSHYQRIATQLRVPLFKGYTMPPSYWLLLAAPGTSWQLLAIPGSS